ncbi:MAG: hypothetical protein E6K77_00010 [Candidatus Eisenbacteria bacterium]|uniref:Uncharacterized protein n=1 Tax=Eiseniibacteriota bacterium TaxID=2212470 RepID=A0A538TU44_UNCEI|nr:MAG: hypothetical protein E6K77_00010 [Candidatus Eisenbacteria bacterium]
MKLPFHWPEVRLTGTGETRPSPKLVSWRSRTVPENPLTRSPFGSRAVIVAEIGTPAVWFLVMFENSRLCSTMDRTKELGPSGMVASDWSCA